MDLHILLTLVFIHYWNKYVITMHDIDKIEINTCIILATSHGSKLCFIINLYFYITFVCDFMPFYMNDGTARVTHFSSTLPFRLDILTMDYFFTSFYLIMLL